MGKKLNILRLVIIGSILFIGGLSHLNGQHLTFYYDRKVFDAENVCDVAYTGCDHNFHIGGTNNFLGYAYHPSGKLWSVADEFLDMEGHHRIKIFETNLESCTFQLLYSIDLPLYWACSGSLNIDYLGRLYLEIAEWDDVHQKSIYTFSRIADPAHPVIERLLILPVNGIGEMLIQNQKIYLVEFNRPNIFVYNMNFQILDTIIMEKHITGLTSISVGCDSVITYASHMGISTQEYQQNGPDTTLYISTYDIETNTLTPVCSYWMGNIVVPTLLISPLEFLSSDPECDLLIDLDRDNSTGVYPYDYLDSTTYCTMIEVPICDDDLYIHSSAPIDSVRLILSGIIDVGFEHLILDGFYPGINLTNQSDSTYILTCSNPLDSNYKKALFAIRYQHDGAHRSGGIRNIIIQGFNEIKEGIKIKSQIQITASPYAGKDAMLVLCSDTTIQSFSSITKGQSGGYFLPGLFSGTDVFNSANDLLASYKYIIDNPVCGNDTAEITILRDNNAPVDILGNDRILCLGDTIRLNVQQPGNDITWDDGSIQSDHLLTKAGEYWVNVKTPDGCIYKDTIEVTEGKLWDGQINSFNPACDQVNGIIDIDSLAFNEALSIKIDGQELATHRLDHQDAGMYQLYSISSDGCVTEQDITLIDQEGIRVEMDSIITVTEGKLKKLKYSLSNQIIPVNVIFDTNTSIKWTGSDIEVLGTTDDEYTITFIDENGCTDIHTLKVRVEKVTGTYIPNIFSPSSTVGNDIWKVSLGSEYELDVLRIYDRWGNLVFQSASKVEWNGNFKDSPCSSGVYVYQLILTSSSMGEKKTLKGEITLVR